MRRGFLIRLSWTCACVASLAVLAITTKGGQVESVVEPAEESAGAAAPSEPADAPTEPTDVVPAAPPGALLEAVQAEDNPQPAADEAESAPEPAHQVAYDIRELLIDVPNFTDAPRFAFHDVEPGSPYSGTGVFVASKPGGFEDGDEDEGMTREEMIERLETILKETIDPDSWRDNGGAFGAIREWDGKLYITQTPANHAAVAAVIEEMRATQSRTVRVRAHWVQTQRAALEPFLKPVSASGAARQANANGRPGGATRPVAGDAGDRVRAGGGAILAIDPADLDGLKGDAVHYRAETLCFDGQRVYLRATRRESLPGATGEGGAANARPAPPAAPVAPASQPSRPGRGSINGFDTGIVLDVANTVSPDAGTAILTLTNQVVDLAGARPSGDPANIVPAPGAAGASPRIRLVLHELKTSARIPLGKTVLIGGMTVDPNGGTPDGSQLYLFVEVTSD